MFPEFGSIDSLFLTGMPPVRFPMSLTVRPVSGDGLPGGPQAVDSSVIFTAETWNNRIDDTEVLIAS